VRVAGTPASAAGPCSQLLAAWAASASMVGPVPVAAGD
jgi:hypothetical protein